MRKLSDEKPGYSVDLAVGSAGPETNFRTLSFGDFERQIVIPRAPNKSAPGKRRCLVCEGAPGLSILASHTCARIAAIEDPAGTMAFLLSLAPKAPQLL